VRVYILWAGLTLELIGVCEPEHLPPLNMCAAEIRCFWWLCSVAVCGKLL